MHYSIADLEKFTGVKAHTLRIWEQRYDIVVPHRTKTNIRYYDDDQLRRLLNISALVRSGLRISKISGLSHDEIQQLVEEDAGNKNTNSFTKEINALITSALSFNEDVFHKTFADCLLLYGIESTYINVLHPLLTTTGLMWTNGEMDVCQEHFVSNLVRQKLYTAADKLSNPSPNAKTWVLFLPQAEEHDIGLLYANFLIRYYGHKVVYLGQRVPIKVLKKNVQTINPDYMLTFLRHTYQVDWAQEFVDHFCKNFSNYGPICAGHSNFTKMLTAPIGLQLIDSPNHFIKLLTE